MFTNRPSLLSAPGRHWDIAPELKPMIERAGFVNIKYEVMKLPLGTWPAEPKYKMIGAYVLVTADSAFEAFGMRLMTGVLGMDLEDVTAIVAQAKKDAHNRQIHSYARQ